MLSNLNKQVPCTNSADQSRLTSLSFRTMHQVSSVIIITWSMEIKGSHLRRTFGVFVSGFSQNFLTFHHRAPARNKSLFLKIFKIHLNWFTLQRRLKYCREEIVRACVTRWRLLLLVVSIRVQANPINDCEESKATLRDKRLFVQPFRARILYTIVTNSLLIFSCLRLA